MVSTAGVKTSTRTILGTEWGAGSDLRLHSNSAHAFDFSMEYQQTYIENYLPFIEEKPWISGCTYWNFIDFNVAERQESMPRVNNKGVAYNDRTLKDVAYYFKSMWRKDVPVVHIASRDWQQEREVRMTFSASRYIPTFQKWNFSSMARAVERRRQIIVSPTSM